MGLQTMFLDLERQNLHLRAPGAADHRRQLEASYTSNLFLQVVSAQVFVFALFFSTFEAVVDRL